MNRSFWRGRRVFLTGHTGFKGTWLTQWLAILGADVTGYSLDEHDVRDLEQLRAAMTAAQPEVVVHLAAQALVRASYDDPVTTFTTNVTGSVHVLQSIRGTPSVRVAVMITSDKCYANSGAGLPFREDDLLGGHDPYSASKAGAELAIAAYRHSYFGAPGAPRVVSVRAGNVIGGGDWSRDRLVPDLVRAFRDGRPAQIRYPDATRPWQFVLDALHGYLLVAEQAWERELPHAFNFGPDPTEARSVRWLADTMAARWGDGASWHQPEGVHPHEDVMLALDSSRARDVLRWRPLLDIESALAWTTDWYKTARGLTAEQIHAYMELSSE
ncbi:MAG TPA: CDP-glucose 4,6-dehydratase [Thermoanaerobaculia bacterium]|jgi:CDP-glucose 4,6-dehydratase|nr:CDP-glucose 4,6-dehydratase [Thermoanaerobaculia bacterium]